MYNINKNEELTTSIISRIIQNFEMTTKADMNRMFNYYAGKQDILKKIYSDSTKPCSRIVKNYCKSIVDNYQGYITGIPVTYSSKNDIGNLIDCLKYNDIHNTDSMLLRNALIFGVAYEIAYVDEEAKPRFKVIDSREGIPVYDDTLNEELLYFIRYYRKPNWKTEIENDNKWIVEVTDAEKVTTYESNFNFSSFVLLGEVPHYFQQVPYSVFKLNDEESCIFKPVLSLQDAYNELLSSEVDDFSAFVDAYLVLKGVVADADDISSMKENRVLMLDADDSAEYLTKNISDTQIQNMLQNINDSIHVIANSPDFNDDKFLSQSGISMRYKLVGFENASSSIVANMTKALQKRIELLYTVLGLISSDAFADVEINFTRNLPQDLTETAQVVNTLRGLVSNKTLVSLLPFVKDVDAELAQLEAEEAEQLNMYDFGVNENVLVGQNTEAE